MALDLGVLSHLWCYWTKQVTTSQRTMQRHVNSSYIHIVITVLSVHQLRKIEYMKSKYFIQRALLYRTELNTKAKLSIYWSVFVPTLSYSHAGRVMSERTRLRLKAAKNLPQGDGGRLP